MSEYLTTKQVAETLGVSVRRVQAMINDGQLPAIKAGRDWLIRPDDLKRVENRNPKGGRPRKAQSAN